MEAEEGRILYSIWALGVREELPEWRKVHTGGVHLIQRCNLKEAGGCKVMSGEALQGRL